MADAKLLLAGGRNEGAYYLAGYAVECALKACVAKQVRAGDFPDKRLAIEAFTHDLERLVAVAGLKLALDHERAANPALDVNWATVKDWTVETRYVTRISARQAQDMLVACTGRNGVLTWVKKRW